MSLPEPYFQRDGVTLYHGDCREILPSLPKVDLVLTDPPYPGLTGGYRHTFSGVTETFRETVSVGDEWSASLDWCVAAKAIARFGAAVFCTHHSVSELAAQFKDWRKVALITWYKRNAPPTGKNVPRFTSEFIWCFAREPGISWDGLETTVFDIPNIQGGCMATERIVDESGACLHPTQKPVRLIKGLIERLDPQTVLDPFAGSGTTLRAAMDLGRKAIGIEISEKYCEIAARRLSQRNLQFAEVM